MHNLWSGLGFGWLGSYLVLSGSPIAAVALTFFDVGAISAPTAFTMIVGSRLGASIVVLLIGLVYILRGFEQRTSLLTGILALLVTATIYVPAAPLGLAMLNDSLHPYPRLLLPSVPAPHPRIGPVDES